MYKFLDACGCTYYDGEAFIYNLPGPGEEWARTDHPNPAEPDGRPCGFGRLHLMKTLDAQHAPQNWWPWEARGVGQCIGEDDEKAAYASVELRRILPDEFAERLRNGEGVEADLYGVDLYRADLSGADLSGANLYRADLSEADLRGADLSGANLYRADLYGARWNEYTIWPHGFKPPEREEAQ